MFESDLEKVAIEWLGRLGWSFVGGPEIAPGEPAAERESYQDVVLVGRLRAAMTRLNPNLPEGALEDALRRVKRPEGASPEERNRALHRLLVDGVTVEYQDAEGRVTGNHVKVVDFDNPEENDWLAVNQFTIVEAANRRPDVMLFLNGLPVGMIELKNPTDENATVDGAHRQLVTYQRDIPSAFEHNMVLVASDGVGAVVGATGAGREWFKQWRRMDEAEGAASLELQTVLEQVFERRNFLDIIRHFLVFESSGAGKIVKKIAGYHQFYAVNAALGETVRAAGIEGGSAAGGERGDRRVGVVWHTQGSGKSLTMAFFAGRVICDPRMANPTIVVLTDRNDLDDQLFSTFSRCQDLLRQPPTQAESREDLRVKLRVEAGGVIFTTIQKFAAPAEEKQVALSDRKNIVVIADEAHRSQYDFIDGLARNLHDALPNASFVGFTGTPVELEDRNTRSVFGNYISVYDIERAVKDRATVPIYYESRLAKLGLEEAERPRIDADFEEVTEGEELSRRENLINKWAQLEAVVGSGKRLKVVAADIVSHFGRRQEAQEGKAMVVCMSRRICVELYQEIVRLRPDWQSNFDSTGTVKVVMTGSASDPLDWQEHVRNKAARESLANQFRDPSHPFKIAIVRDMWLTGFDAPSLSTIYIDKPMRGHGLMQAIARVNRVFKDKPGGLVVDYLGIAHELKKALATYTQSGGSGEPVVSQEEAIALMLEKHEVCKGILHGIDLSVWVTGAAEQKLKILPEAMNIVLGQENGKARFSQAVTELSQAFALAVPSDQALQIRDEVSFFQAVRASLIKKMPGEAKTEEELDRAVRQIVSRAVAPGGVIDLFEAAGVGKPDVSVLSESFLSEVKGLPQRNLAFELLRRLLSSQLKSRERKSIVQSRSFAEVLGRTVDAYQKRALEAAEAISKLVELAREMRGADARAGELGLSTEEAALFDALSQGDSVVAEVGVETLKGLAKEIASMVREKTSVVDWSIRESVRAGVRVQIKRALNRGGYPVASQEAAVKLILEQAEAIGEIQ
jgi:type I restriction enzyme R subunit